MDWKLTEVRIFFWPQSWWGMVPRSSLILSCCSLLLAQEETWELSHTYISLRFHHYSSESLTQAWTLWPRYIVWGLTFFFVLFYIIRRFSATNVPEKLSKYFEHFCEAYGLVSKQWWVIGSKQKTWLCPRISSQSLTKLTEMRRENWAPLPYCCGKFSVSRQGAWGVWSTFGSREGLGLSHQHSSRPTSDSSAWLCHTFSLFER